MPLVNNADGFFNDLPMINAKGKHSKQQLRLTRAQKDAMQLQLYEQRHAQLAAKIAALKGAAAAGNNADGARNDAS